MSLLAAAVVPSAPLMVPALAGRADADAGLRERALAAVAALLAAAPGRVVVVGAAPATGPIEGDWDWSGFGVRQRGGPGPALPLGPALGAWLLDRVAPERERQVVGVAADLPPSACASLGARLADDDLGLLVVGDGSARHGEKAPGHLDPRAEGFDRAAATALAAGDPAALLALDPVEAAELLAAGRAPWQVLAGAAAGTAWRVAQAHAEVPHGVAYHVVTWVRG